MLTVFFVCRLCRSRHPHPHAHPDEDDDDDDEDEEQAKPAPTAKRLSPAARAEVAGGAVGAIPRSRTREDRGSTASERSDASGSAESDESSTAGESGGGPTDDERDLSSRDKTIKDKDSAGNSSKDVRREAAGGDGDNGGGPLPMDIDDADDEARPPAPQVGWCESNLVVVVVVMMMKKSGVRFLLGRFNGDESLIMTMKNQAIEECQ